MRNNALFLFTGILFVSAVALILTRDQNMEQPAIDPDYESSVSTDEEVHEQECRRVVNGYLVWRSRNTVDVVEPMGSSDTSIASAGTADAPYLVFAGTAHFKLNGSRKEADFVCDNEGGERHVAFTSGVLQGVRF